jgi:hypothetical protein
VIPKFFHIYIDIIMGAKATIILMITGTFFAIMSYKAYRNTSIKMLIPSCGVNDSCVRVCCTKLNSCQNNTVFEISKFLENLTPGFNVLKGNPCDADRIDRKNVYFQKVKKKYFYKNYSKLSMIVIFRTDGWLLTANMSTIGTSTVIDLIAKPRSFAEIHQLPMGLNPRIITVSSK